MQPNFLFINDLWLSHFLLMMLSLTFYVPKILFIITNIMLLLLYEICVLFINTFCSKHHCFLARGNGKFQFLWYWGHCFGLKDQYDQDGPSNHHLWGAAPLSDTDKLNRVQMPLQNDWCLCFFCVWLFSYCVIWYIWMGLLWLNMLVYCLQVIPWLGSKHQLTN